MEIIVRNDGAQYRLIPTDETNIEVWDLLARIEHTSNIIAANYYVKEQTKKDLAAQVERAKTILFDAARLVLGTMMDYERGAHVEIKDSTRSDSDKR